MNYEFTTQKLIVKQWHSFNPTELNQPDLIDIINDMLEPDITVTFSMMWRGNYDRERTESWIKERDTESKTLLAIDKTTKDAIGVINFFKVGDRSKGIKLRVGYFVSKVMWSKGFATELMEGFTHWCRENNISTIFAGVEPHNIASIRVLEKNNFSNEKTEVNGRTLLFVYNT
ncbi:MAG: Unknown protein [uncultured Sulfurovum sp.]|uniref:N-acetyltransferase domain-containing protein n=1 Tax=uncultured Sulfurovum sp. TaxID=269237 RepID=A0A6S6TT48_9BACT|nr:MAG: Unknown protein [uncultured Sulfurovum sp.]